MIAALLLTVTGALAFRALARNDVDPVFSDPRPVTVTTGTTPSFADPLADARPATAPFEGLTEATVVVEGRALRVVIADEPTERSQGLRERATLGPYDAMLFVFPADADGPFTMARVPVDLDIRWLDQRGEVVAATRMTACPDGDDQSCPRYEPGATYRFALETIASG
ncbi:MAG TPA: DUF192 domain-containing protein [Acidimicrobiia bacterium]|nr:DUF192 domain-containing protein [Acidimicrobiia bacterium]